jgi:hypothetical protein
MIDKAMKAWVLEVNANPSLSVKFEKDATIGLDGRKVKEPLAEDEEEICPVDMYVKSRVVTDAISLAREASEDIQNTDKFNSLSKILPCEQDQEAS